MRNGPLDFPDHGLLKSASAVSQEFFGGATIAEGDQDHCRHREDSRFDTQIPVSSLCQLVRRW